MIPKKKIWLSIFLLFGIIHLVFSQENGKRITILCTSSLLGRLDGCECPEERAGGLVATAGFLRASRTASRQTILVDAGDALPAEPDYELSWRILESYRDLGYDAVGLGDTELFNAASLLEGCQAAIPLVASNLFLKGKKGWAAFPTSVVLRPAGDLTIGILSLLDPDCLSGVREGRRERLRLSAPVPAAEKAIALGKSQGADCLVLLYHGGYRNAVQVAEALPELDVIVLAHEGLLRKALKVGRCIIFSPGKAAGVVGILTITASAKGVESFESEFRYFDYRREGRDPLIERRALEYRAILRARLLQ